MPQAFSTDHSQSKNTKNTTKYGVTVLQDFMTERGMSTVDLLSLEEADLDTYLEDFYANIRNQKSDTYKKNTLLSIRQSLNRYFRDSGKKFDIIKDPTFTKANNCFKALLRKTRIDGKGFVKHHDAISVPDIRKMYNHEFLFNANTPMGLVNKVFFEIVLYFCRRGQENLTELSVDDFEIVCMDDGRKYVSKCTSELTKNHQGDSSESEGTGGKMFSTGTDLCPVASFEKYLSKRPQDYNRLFLHPKDAFSDGDSVWYRKEAMGRDYLGGMMKKYSKTANLSKTYTNHCIRATCITILNHCGFESRHITTVSGHRNQQSLASYCYDTSGMCIHLFNYQNYMYKMYIYTYSCT